MIPQSQSKIFLHYERGHAETDWFRSYHTFNFGSYQDVNKSAAGCLYVLNDDTLAGQRSISLTIEAPTCILLLPVVGAIAYATDAGLTGIVEAGEGCWIHASTGSILKLTNPFEDELVNYIQLWFRQPVAAEKPLMVSEFSFDLNNNQNTALQLGDSGVAGLLAHIGKFDGRAEYIYYLQSPRKALFLFVVQGAFEAQYRLLHERDSLLLWDLNEVELEALSNDAIVLALEFDH